MEDKGQGFCTDGCVLYMHSGSASYDSEMMGLRTHEMD